MKSEQMNAYLIYPHSTVVEAMQKIDSNAKGILFVVKEKNVLIGVITDGDIRRWLIKTGNLQEEVSKIMNLSPRVLYRKDVKTAQEYMAKYQITALPIITAKGRVTDIIFKQQEMTEDLPHVCRHQELLCVTAWKVLWDLLSVTWEVLWQVFVFSG